MLTSCTTTVVQNGLKWEETDIVIGEYTVYGMKEDDTVLCDSMFRYGIVYQKDNVYYTSYDLFNDNGCAYTYTILYQGELISLKEAVEIDVLTYEEIETTDFKVDMIERETIEFSKDIVKVEFYQDNELVHTYDSVEDINQLRLVLSDIHFIEATGDTNNEVFRIVVFFDTDTMTFIVTENGISVDGETLVHYYNDDLMYDIRYTLEAYLNE
jgi:hypothetical protein